MTLKNSFPAMAVAALVAVGATPSGAAHANPWAEDLTTVDARNHEINQARSADTPGEDEMRGRMTGTAYGKTDGNAAVTASGNDGIGPEDGSGAHGFGKR